MNWNIEPEREKYGSPMVSARKQIIVFSVGWLGFQLFANIINLLTGIFLGILSGTDATTALSNASLSMFINGFSYFSLFVAFMIILFTDLPKLIKSFKQWQSFLAAALCYGAIFFFNIFYGIIVRAITPITDNVNQASVENLQKLFPFWSFLIFGFIAPVCEEITYRTGLFSLLRRKNRVLAYVVTILVFTLIHSNFTVSNFYNEFLNLPYYAFAAFAFSYVYEKYGFAASISAHILNNVVSCLLAILN